ncbi:hypothetical protein C8Q76DRAFT_774634 [Earliella scabrosa]|nr:hypothetical protein C8Q76DRAFT_774634 [Earliella scabrosa]
MDPSVPSPLRSDGPFPFNKPNTDIILRTSDHVDFHVFSQILIAASPFFEGLFEVPQPPPDQQQLKYGKPIVEVSEDSLALEALLRLCYPINKPKCRPLNVTVAALRASMKYEMEMPITVLTKELEDNAVDFPLEVWAAAAQLRLESLAEHAAYHLVRFKHELDFSVLDYFRIRQYYHWRAPSPGFRFLTPPDSESQAPTPRPFQTSEITIPSQSLPELPGNPAPDLICRARDGRELHAHQLPLSLASLYVRQLINSNDQLSTPSDLPSSQSRQLPVVEFDAHSTTLHTLLMICYRAPPSHILYPDNPSTFMALLDAADKYQMDAAQRLIRAEWSTVAKSKPLAAFCAAIHSSRTDCAHEAAKILLRHPVNDVYIPELETIPALPYHRLLCYHQECVQIAEGKLKELAKSASSATAAPEPLALPQESEPKNATPQKTKKKTARTSKSWARKYVEGLSSALALHGPAVPITATAKEILVAATRGAEENVWCERCQPLAVNILEVHDRLRNLEVSLDQVVLTL